MASADSIDDLLANPHFMDLVQTIHGVAINTQRRESVALNANLVIDALTFVAAMLQEAHPDCESDERLAEASDNLASESRGFLHFMRDHARETGHHLLDRMDPAQDPSADAKEEAREGDVDRVTQAIQMAIMAQSRPVGHMLSPQGDPGAFIAFHLATVTEALAFVLASFAAQSGEITTAKDRRLFADNVRENFLRSFREIEQDLPRLSAALPSTLAIVGTRH